MAARRRVTTDAAARREPAGVLVPAEEQVDGDPDRERVLLVDDRPDNLMALEAVLEPLDLELVTAGSGDEALRILLESDVSAIVLDVQMPDMDGFETASLLKAREATRSVPVLFLTAVGLSLEHELRGYEVGAADYICKPFEPKVLQAKVRAAVRSGAELRALRRATRVYQEAAEALAAVPGREGPLARTGRRAVDHSAVPVAMSRCIDLGLEASLSAPAAARAALRDALAGEPAESVDVAVLLVSELLANAVVHAGTDIGLRLDVGDEVLRVEVEDSGPHMPDPVAADVTAEGGRGWLLVERLADRCGWTRLPHGKAAWFELDRGAGRGPGYGT